MNKKGIILMVLLALLSVSALLGLSCMTERMKESRREAPVYATVAPEEIDVYGFNE